jgi:hypothetical protein
MPIDTGLISRWKFDEGTGTAAADSVGTSPATLFGDASWTAGHINSAISLSGTGYASASLSGIDLSTGAFTIAFWFFDDRSLSSGFQRFLSWGDGSTGIQVGLSNRQVFFNRTNGGSGDAVTAGALATGSHHVILTFDGAATYIYYIDGSSVSLGSSGTTYIIPNTSGNLYIGQRGDSAGFVVGWIDDMRIYNRALSSVEAAQLAALNSDGTFGLLDMA